MQAKGTHQRYAKMVTSPVQHQQWMTELVHLIVQILTSGHDTGTIEITYMEETLAELWANSAAAKEEFPDHPDVARRAVSLLCSLSLFPISLDYLYKAA